MINNKYFITGIGTDIGKTVISALLIEKLKADYWKPIQAGNLEDSDSHFIQKFTNCKKIHSEQFKLTEPMSPHAAAKIDNININLNEFKIPSTIYPLIIEGAGGLMVPINDNDLVLDLIKHFNIPVIIVSKNYLGSINHTLLTIEVLMKNNIQIKGVIFNGDSNPETERIIVLQTGIHILGKIPTIEKITKDSIIHYSQEIHIS